MLKELIRASKHEVLARLALSDYYEEQGDQKKAEMHRSIARLAVWIKEVWTWIRTYWYSKKARMQAEYHHRQCSTTVSGRTVTVTVLRDWYSLECDGRTCKRRIRSITNDEYLDKAMRLAKSVLNY